MRDSARNLSVLRERIAGEWPPGEACANGLFASGHRPLDAHLGGGFQRGQLHEIFAPAGEDNGCAAGFAAMLAQCGLQPGKSILWLRTLTAIRRGGRFNPAGFAELGGDPASMLMAVAPDETRLLRSAGDALRCGGFGIVVIECWGSPAILDLTASRRLTLAADRTGVTAILLRPEASEQPSTASTRWAVAPAPSTALAANAPGHPVLDLTLLRQRAGPSGRSWLVEWDRDKRSFRQPSRPAKETPAQETPGQDTLPARHPPVPGAVVPVPSGRPAAAEPRVKLTA